MSPRKWTGILASVIVLTLGATLPPLSADQSQPDVPTVNAGIGSCRADFNVKDGTGKPLYNAKISTTIKYGFMNMRQAQLEAPTNTNGQARFTGLPNFSKKPLEFVISSGTVSKTETDDPAANCNAVYNVTLTVH